ncbi:MAG: HEPN domain-containing protein [Candidatus Kapaibacterium sp.]|nr:MAG: HEPN domain-containing protein [Candidatus Kapabacteria bacterium]
MTPEELQTLRSYRMEQARAALEDAEFLLAHNRAALSVVNRAYYAMFYAALALLQDVSPLPSKHTGIIGLFDTNFIRTGIFDKQRSKDLHRAFDLRQASDYKTITPITNEQAHEITESARIFVEYLAHFLSL